jgi:hypothetical protein
MKTCENCRFSLTTNLYDEFQCRRHAPKQRKNRPWGFPELVTTWPMVRSGDWCGDWEHSPNDIRSES